jgi:hypothetical protein
MPELTMAPAGSHEPPTILFEQSQQLAHFHRESLGGARWSVDPGNRTDSKETATQGAFVCATSRERR